MPEDDVDELRELVEPAAAEEAAEPAGARVVVGHLVRVPRHVAAERAELEDGELVPAAPHAVVDEEDRPAVDDEDGEGEGDDEREQQHEGHEGDGEINGALDAVVGSAR